VDDDVDAFERRAQACAVGHVALDELAPERLEPGRLPLRANQAPDRPVSSTQGVHDVPADEAAAAGNQNHLVGSCSKFCQ
jgi:hypothetical protein